MTKQLAMPALILTLALSAPAADRQNEQGNRGNNGSDRAAADDRAPGPRVRLGGVTVGAAYVSGPGWYGPGWYGPGWYGPYRAGWWDPFWYGPYLHPAYFSGFNQGPGMGEVKIKAAPKDAMVFLDGAYAGTVEKLKSIWLEPGIYNLELKDENGRTWKQRVYVLSGKKLEVEPRLERS
jgi:hypothetical protein